MYKLLAIKKLTQLLALSLLLVITGCSREHQTLQNDAVILAFGDSLTEGYGVKPSQAYPSVLQQLSGHKVINAGVSGETTDKGLARLRVLLEQESFDLVILFEGGNDILQKRPYQTIKQNLKKMIELLQAEQKQILLIGVPEKRLFASSAAFYKELAEQYELPIEEDIVGDLMIRPSMKSDYVHLNAKGYRQLVKTIYQKLVNSGALAD